MWDVSEDSSVSLRSVRFKRDNTIELNYGDYNLVGQYFIDPLKNPKQITITIDGRALPTIYEVDGQTLKLGKNKIGEPIPRNFTNAIIFQRDQ